HLTSLYGEEPKLSCSVMANHVVEVSVRAKFSAETLETYPQIEETIRNYIVENYPILNIKRLKISIYDKNKSSLDIIKDEHPMIYKCFGKLIEKKLAAMANTNQEQEIPS
ncbi:MAG: hypothetical protein U1C33_07775, partial [Candidatus Cloacimonadaceae bacterium]|nr:hypothetical protein [Candidatus Cloacimonadaceae bacterium]